MHRIVPLSLLKTVFLLSRQKPGTAGLFCVDSLARRPSCHDKHEETIMTLTLLLLYARPVTIWGWHLFFAFCHSARRSGMGLSR